MHALRWVLILGFVANVTSGFAATHRHASSVTQTATLHESSSPPPELTVAFAGRFFDYREVVDGKTFDTENGFLPGVEAGLALPVGRRGWVFNADTVALFGNTSYDGGTWYADGRPGEALQATTSNVIWDLALTAGYDLTRERKHHWTPYAGVGGHFWARNLSGAPGGYDERYYFLYLPVGIRYRHDVSQRLTVAADLSGRWNLGGWIKAQNFSNGGYADTGTLGMAFGTRLAVPVTVHLQRGFNLALVPFFEYFGIGQGGTIHIYNRNGSLATVGQEPDSRSFLYGFNAATQVTF